MVELRGIRYVPVMYIHNIMQVVLYIPQLCAKNTFAMGNYPQTAPSAPKSCSTQKLPPVSLQGENVEQSIDRTFSSS